MPTRPAFGERHGHHTDAQPQAADATVRPNVMKRREPDYRRSGEIVRFDAEISDGDLFYRIKEVVEHTAKTVNLEEADIIVSGGRA